jgi:hypothetical protein
MVKFEDLKPGMVFIEELVEFPYRTSGAHLNYDIHIVDRVDATKVRFWSIAIDGGFARLTWWKLGDWERRSIHKPIREDCPLIIKTIFSSHD